MCHSPLHRRGSARHRRATLCTGFRPDARLVGQAPRFLPPSIGYAWILLDAGDPANVDRAESILRAVLLAQEMRPDSADYEQFRMRFEDASIADLNAVQRVLIELIPLARVHGDRLSSALRDDQSVTLGDPHATAVATHDPGAKGCNGYVIETRDVAVLHGADSRYSPGLWRWGSDGHSRQSA